MVHLVGKTNMGTFYTRNVIREYVKRGDCGVSVYFCRDDDGVYRRKPNFDTFVFIGTHDDILAQALLAGVK